MEAKIAVATIGNDTYRAELKVGEHVVIADESKDIGGKNLGPRPGDFYRMSLASYRTLRMYADRKNINVKIIEVSVSTEEAEGKTILHGQVKIAGNLDEAQCQLQIAKPRSLDLKDSMSYKPEKPPLLF